MTLAEFQAKFEGVLLSAPMIAAAIIDLVQDERADEREQIAVMADEWGEGCGMGVPASEFDRRYGKHDNLMMAIRNRAAKESN